MQYPAIELAAWLKMLTQQLPEPGMLLCLGVIFLALSMIAVPRKRSGTTTSRGAGSVPLETPVSSRMHPRVGPQGA